MKNIVFVLLSLIEFTVFSEVNAQDTINHKSVDELFFLSLDEFLNIVITPSKLPQSEGNITQKVDVLDAKEIETFVFGSRNLCEIVGKLPGTSISVLSRNDANWGTYGGIGPKYSTYMLQGLPVDAFIDPMSLDLGAIDHIEVQRGPASVIYPNYLSQDFAGNQSPLAGTVNLVLKGKIEQQETSFQTSYGSFNTLNGQVFHQNHSGRLNYFGGITFEMSDYTNYGSDSSWLNIKKEPEYNKTRVYGGLTLFMDKNEKQKLTLFYQKTIHTGDAGRVYRGFNNRYGTLNIGYDLTFNDQFHLQSHLGMRSYFRTWQESNFGVIDTLKSTNGVDQVIIPADICLSWIRTEKNSLSIGADYQGTKYSTWSDPLIGYNLYGNKSSSVQAGVYLQEEWHPITELILRSGLRYAYIKNLIALVNSSGPDKNSESWKKLLWSIGARYLMNNKFSFYANVGSSFAPPGIKSTCGTIPMIDYGIPGRNGQLPNPGLTPEKGVGADIGIDCKLPAHFKIDTRVFYIILQDAIIDNIVSLDPSQTQSINAEATSKGGEIEISQRINSALLWYANATLMKTNIMNDSNQLQNNVEIPFSPNTILNLGIYYDASFGFKLAPYLNYNGGFYDGIVKNQRKWFAPGILLNIFIAQRIVRGDSYVVECFTQLYNLTNNDYEMPWQFKNPGFSGMFGIRVTFK